MSADQQAEYTELSQIPEQNAARHPDEPALLRLGSPGMEEECFSYGELEAMVVHGAGRLAAMDLGAGTPVLLCLGPGPQFAAALFAIWRAGLVAAPVAADLDEGLEEGLEEGELGKLAAHCGAGATIRDPARLFGPGEVGSLPSRPKSEDLAVLAFTSGSTGRPRAAELSHRNLLGNLKGLLQIRHCGPGDVFLSLLPPFHLFEITVGLLAPLASGAKIVYPGHPLPNRVLMAMRTAGITHSLLVPALLEALYAELREELIEREVLLPNRHNQPLAQTVANLRAGLAAAEDLAVLRGIRKRIGTSLHTIISGGAALASDWQELLAWLDITLEVGYGLTEASPVVALGRAGLCPEGSVGQPLPGVEVSIGGDGEILVRGPGIMRGYHKDPEASAESLCDGWLHTGDHGYLDPLGHLFITGRKKEILVTACGENISPEEVESAYQSPLFLEVGVTSQKDPEGNDEPQLVVVPSPGARDEKELRSEIAVLRAAAPPRLRVRDVYIHRGPLPRTRSGKLRRQELCTWLETRMGGTEQDHGA